MLSCIFPINKSINEDLAVFGIMIYVPIFHYCVIFITIRKYVRYVVVFPFYSIISSKHFGGIDHSLYACVFLYYIHSLTGVPLRIINWRRILLNHTRNAFFGLLLTSYLQLVNLYINFDIPFVSLTYC